MYIDDSIPATYDRIAEISNNYIVLVKEQTLRSNNSYDAYYQFFIPSTYVLHVDDYQIYKGTNYVSNYNYINNQYFSYIDDVNTNYSITTQELFDRSSGFWDRGDCFQILGCAAIVIIFVLFCLNAVTSLVEKGGVFNL